MQNHNRLHIVDTSKIPTKNVFRMLEFCRGPRSNVFMDLNCRTVYLQHARHRADNLRPPYLLKQLIQKITDDSSSNLRCNLPSTPRHGFSFAVLPPDVL